MSKINILKIDHLFKTLYYEISQIKTAIDKSSIIIDTIGDADYQCQYCHEQIKQT